MPWAPVERLMTQNSALSRGPPRGKSPAGPTSTRRTADDPKLGPVPGTTPRQKPRRTHEHPSNGCVRAHAGFHRDGAKRAVQPRSECLSGLWACGRMPDSIGMGPNAPYSPEANVFRGFGRAGACAAVADQHGISTGPADTTGAATLAAVAAVAAVADQHGISTGPADTTGAATLAAVAAVAAVADVLARPSPWPPLPPWPPSPPMPALPAVPPVLARPSPWPPLPPWPPSPPMPALPAVPPVLARPGSGCRRLSVDVPRIDSLSGHGCPPGVVGPGQAVAD